MKFNHIKVVSYLLYLMIASWNFPSWVAELKSFQAESSPAGYKAFLAPNIVSNQSVIWMRKSIICQKIKENACESRWKKQVQKCLFSKIRTEQEKSQSAPSRAENHLACIVYSQNRTILLCRRSYWITQDTIQRIWLLLFSVSSVMEFQSQKHSLAGHMVLILGKALKKGSRTV